jgi:hypothetical protein
MLSTLGPGPDFQARNGRPTFAAVPDSADASLSQLMKHVMDCACLFPRTSLNYGMLYNLRNCARREV